MAAETTSDATLDSTHDVAFDVSFDAGAPMDSLDDLPATEVAPVDASPCPTTQNLCGAQCVSLRSDPAHCGACGASCVARFTDGLAACVSGACTLIGCAANRGDCDGESPNGCETNIRTSADHCGRCGATCQFPNASARCENGFCQIDECLVGFADCNGNAFDGCEANLSRSARNCGRCGTGCLPLGGRAICVGGTCGVTAVTCMAGTEDCDGESPNGCEVSLLTDVTQCGACGEGCVTPNGRPTCTAGRCGIGECNAGYGNCDGNPSNGCETSLSRSLSHCGACRSACVFAHGVGACAAGTCRLAACLSGWADCNGSAPDGCEVDVTTSGSNCGECGTACGAAQLCSMGACVSDCVAPSSICGGRCADLTQDTSNCGACGNTCAAGPNATATCTGGRCGVTCATGYGDCDGSAANGCEVNLGTVATHCGRCGNACVGGQVCVGGVCGCAIGHGFCGGACRDVQSDGANCGACGRACAVGQACVAGTCPTTVTCPEGQTACGTTCRALTTDLAHCGRCGNACAAGQVCVGGACRASCTAGQSNCGGECRPTGGACTEGDGACARTGTIVCAIGTNTACSATAGASSAEVCDGIDNDCNGTVDDGIVRSCYSGPAGTLGVGICRPGNQNCTVGEWRTCSGQVTPGAEVCNNVDDDCDGVIDEGLGTTTCGTGACQRTVSNCLGGVPQACTPSGGTDVCDGVDNDCDGLTDEGFCRIGGSCFNNGTVNPLNICQVCLVPSLTVSGPTNWSNQSDSTACNDSNVCTSTDRCNGSGVCVGANPVVCNDANPCTVDPSCDPTRGCYFSGASNTTACNDGNACTQTDLCNGSGVCVGANPVVCAAPTGGSATCAGGACRSSCPTGTTLCTGACVSGTCTLTVQRSCTPMVAGCGLVEIAGGTFTMGEAGSYDASPAQAGITVGDYALDAYEVTVARFNAFWAMRTASLATIRSASIAYPGGQSIAWGAAAPAPQSQNTYCNWSATTTTRDAHPMNCMDYWLSQEFCVWDGGRLPTDAEWEYAARGRAVGALLSGRIYPWGDTPSPGCDRVQMSGCGGSEGGQTRPVGTFAASAGLFDMAGNVWEWTADNFAVYSTGASSACGNRSGLTNVLCNTSATGDRVVRGGSWLYDVAYLRAASRFSNAHDLRRNNLGFRCARTRP